MKPEMTQIYEPAPKVVTPGSMPSNMVVPPPSDAIVLFDGKDLSKWKGKDGEAKWKVSDGVFTVNKGTGDIETKQTFEDFQLHIEWKIPADIQGQSQSEETAAYLCRAFMNCRCLTLIITPPISTDKQVVSISRARLW
jgi:hypothetical protein